MLSQRPPGRPACLPYCLPYVESLHAPTTSTTTWREHAAACPTRHPPRQTATTTTTTAAGRSMTACSHPTATTRTTTPSPSSPSPSSSSQSPLPPLFRLTTPGSASAAFTFRIAPRPAMTLLFPPRPSPPRPRKRARALNDIDGEHSCLQKKKRRLRLFLITSRLSPQFSHPATNIVDRGSSKIAVWAKQRSLGRNLLRKAAILNRVRRRSISLKEREAGLANMFVDGAQEQKQLELAKLAFVYGSNDAHTRPTIRASEIPPALVRQTDDPFEPPVASSSAAPSPANPSPPSSSSAHGDDTPVYRSPNDAYYSPCKAQVLRRPPLPPSPLGLSNYDALDLEDDIYDPYSYLYDDEEEEDDGATEGGRSPSASTSASFASTLSTSGTGMSEMMRSPPQIAFCDFGVLDHGEPVLGDDDQVDQGAEAIWPGPTAKDAPSRPLLPASSSPNFVALLATTRETTAPFSPNFAQGPGAQADASVPPLAGLLSAREDDDDVEQERGRQRDLMFLQFNQ